MSVPTSEDGHFRVSGLPPTSAEIAVARTAQFASAGACHVAFVDFAPGETKSMVLRLPNVARVAGVVVDDSGSTVPAATVRYAAVRGLEPSGVTATGADGRFNLVAVKPGDVIVLVAEVMDARSDELQVTVQQQGVEEVRLQLHRADGVIAGRVVDAHGQPMQARVHVQGSDSSGHFQRFQRDSEYSGAFTLAGLPAGTYAISLGPSGDGGIPLGIVHTVTLAPGQRVRGVHLVYDLNSMPVIGGIVVDPDGNPVVGARVTTRGAMIYASEPTGDDGYFLISGLDDGVEYSLTCQHPGYTRGSGTVAATGTLDVRLEVRPRAAIHGRVVDAESGKAITRFAVDTRRSDGGRLDFRPKEDVDGWFSISPVTGDDELAVRAENYREGRVPIPGLSNGEVLEDLLIALEPADVRLMGRVTNTQGRPIAGATVHLGELQPFEAAPDFAATTDDDGSFEMTLTSDEPDWISITHPHFAIASFLVDPRIASVQLFVLEEGGSVVVHLEAPEPVGVTLGNPGEGVFYVQQSDAAGEARFAGVLSGNYPINLVFERPGRPVSLRVDLVCEVQNGRTTEVNLGRVEPPE